MRRLAKVVANIAGQLGSRIVSTIAQKAKKGVGCGRRPWEL